MGFLLNRTTLLAMDLVALSAAFWLSFLLRFELEVPVGMLERGVILWPYVVLLQYAGLHALGVPRSSWRFVGLREVKRTLVALLGVAVVLVVLRLVSAAVYDSFAYAEYSLLPFGVIFIDLTLAFLLVVGLRVSRRMFGELSQTRSLVCADSSSPTLLIGAGQAGFMVSREIAQRPDLGLAAVGFLDDDPAKQGRLVSGVPVLGRIADLPRVVEAYGITEVLISISSAPGDVVRRVTALAEESGAKTKIVPGIYEIVGGDVNLSRLRSVAIEDLLRRPPVQLDRQAIAGVVSNRDVLVSGAAGSIGSELCRQICSFGPSSLILFEQDETGLFYMERELQARFPGLKVIPVLGSVLDAAHVGRTLEQFNPTTVFHAAAYKHVPMGEVNPATMIKNNVLGTQALAKACQAAGVNVFVMVSTDKAVNPTSVMGATKRLAECYVQALGREGSTRFVTVRFGNVLGSSGSVVPVFEEQIRQGGPVTVTHQDMTRYFMTIREACQLITQAASMGEGGEIFVLDMGEPVKIMDLAHDLITLSGLKPGEDVEIQVTGVRPGEKLFEELTLGSEDVDATKHASILVGKTARYDLAWLEGGIHSLEEVLADLSPDELRGSLMQLVPEYRPLSFVAPEQEVASSMPVHA